jgi:hypothetical protein
VHAAPAYGVDDFNSCVAHGMAIDDILNPVTGSGVYDAEPAAVRRATHLESLRGHHRCAARCGSPARHRHIPAQLPALLAAQDTGDLPRRRAMVRADGRSERRHHRRVR